MIFICTCSQDTTTDLLIPHLKDSPIFRFNIDKPEDYTWDFSRRGFEISNVKSSTTITSRTLSSFYLRKPKKTTAHRRMTYAKSALRFARWAPHGQEPRRGLTGSGP